MRLLFDENLSPKLPEALQDAYPGSVHVRTAGLERAADTQVWRYAAEHGFAVVSKDDDFRHLSFLLGAPPKVIGIQAGNCTTRRLEEILRDARPRGAAFATDPTASFLSLP